MCIHAYKYAHKPVECCGVYAFRDDGLVLDNQLGNSPLKKTVFFFFFSRQLLIASSSSDRGDSWWYFPNLCRHVDLCFIVPILFSLPTICLKLRDYSFPVLTIRYNLSADILHFSFFQSSNIFCCKVLEY